MAEEHGHKPISSWSELFAKTAEVGLGAATLTVEAAQKLVNELVGHGHVAKEEGESLVDKLMALGREQREQLTQMVNKGVEQTMIRMDLARRSDLEALRQRVTALETQVLGQCKSDGPITPIVQEELSHYE